MSDFVTLSANEARRRMVSWLALAQPGFSADRQGVGALLSRLRHIQLDPLDAIGTNADLVAMARIDGLKRGDVYRHLGPDDAGVSPSFEHMAKVRCILPASFFPWYRVNQPKLSWWDDGKEKRLPDGALEAVLAELAERGPVTPQLLADLGRVAQRDWSGWKSTGKAATLALEVLWARCEVVVSGKDGRGRRLYDLPSRAFPEHAEAEAGPWGEWALTQRADAAGMLPANMGPWWSMLRQARKDGTVDRLVESGQLVRVRVEGSTRKYLVPAAFLEHEVQPWDDRLRILGPLDPLLWDRKLVGHAFAFDYIWEVYKPAAKRRWGWYVCPLLHCGKLVGRLEARSKGEVFEVQNLWWEDGGERRAALVDAVEQHAEGCGAVRIIGL
ncbi:MAG: AlkZ family DNA glycosylase [Deltaproteobacteria bacterium]|nr:AlkZ family DNA glycosylase [Deltaproteobacteria bacterium]